MSTDCNINNNSSQIIVKHEIKSYQFQPGNTASKGHHWTQQWTHYRNDLLKIWRQAGGSKKLLEIAQTNKKVFIMLTKELNKLLPKQVDVDISKTESKLVLISSIDKQSNTTQVIDTTPVKQIDDNSSLDTVSNAVVDGSKDTGQL